MHILSFPLAPIVLTGRRVERKYEPLTFCKNVTLVPMTWAPREYLREPHVFDAPPLTEELRH